MITFQMLQKIVKRKENSAAAQYAIKRKNVVIYRRMELDGTPYTLILFTKAKQAFMELYDAKVNIILFDKYLLMLDGPTTEKVNFNHLRVFNVDEGTMEKRVGVDFGICEKKDVVIIDEHLLVLKQKSHPRFAVIINDRLTEVPFLIAEDILRMPTLSAPQQNSIKAFYSHEKWENHNNILINPVNFSVPSLMALTFFCKQKPTWQMLKNSKKLDAKMIEVILSFNKKDKPQITYLRSETLQ